MVYHGCAFLLSIQHCGIAFVPHSPDVQQLRDAGLAPCWYQTLLVCTGHAGVTISKDTIGKA